MPPAVDTLSQDHSHHRGVSSRDGLRRQPVQWDTLAEVVALHLKQLYRQGRSALVLHVDGMGKTSFLRALEEYLTKDLRAAAGDTAGADQQQSSAADVGEQPWVVVRFSAWEYQRVAPPWWWLVAAINREGLKALSKKHQAQFRRRDILWRLRQANVDRLVIALLVVALLAALLSVRVDMSTTSSLDWVTKAIAAVFAIAAAIRAFGAAIRGHVLLNSPRGAAALLRNAHDPLELVKRRYAFLVRALDRPLAVFIDELDRCKAPYVVELLEGVQTLFVNNVSLHDGARVVYVVAASEDWLCESYRQEYNAFADTIHRPGRPFAADFLDRAFDFAIVIPEIASRLRKAYCTQPIDEPRPAAGSDTNLMSKIDESTNEHEIRTALADCNDRLDDGLRTRAISKLKQLDEETHERLASIAAELDIRPQIAERLGVAYCFAFATQILSGRVIEDDNHATARLARWTILNMEWPTLARYLAEQPDEVDRVHRGLGSESRAADINAALSSAAVRRVAFDGDSKLTTESVRRYVAAE